MGAELHPDSEFPDSDSGPDSAADNLSPKEQLQGKRAKRRVKRAQLIELGEARLSGAPSLASLRPAMVFLAAPVLIAILIVLTGGHWPTFVLYPIAIALGLWLAASTLYSMELVAVCIVFYFPFAHEYAVPIAPGLNGTNALILLGLLGMFLRVYVRKEGWARMLPGCFLVLSFGAYSALSGFTILREPGGLEYLLYGELINYKGWLDQFFIYFILINAVRTKDMAKRMMVYMALSAMVVVISGIPEMIDKMGLSTIDKSRLEGPYGQANNYGGFIAYTTLPMIAFFMVYARNIKAWLLTPYFLLAAKILITTFSRGAYVAIAIGGLVAAWFRGKSFMMIWGVLGLALVLVFPQVLPQAVLDRIAQTVGEKTSDTHRANTPDQLDTSSAHRLIMWKAGGQMMLDNPLLGKGYKGYAKVKSEYTEIQIDNISDPHNMYIFIGAQMGIPALSLYLLILLRAYTFGWQLSKYKEDQFVRAIGIGGAAATVCYAFIAIFGSRMVSLDFTSHFWAIFVVLQVLHASTMGSLEPSRRVRRKTPSRGAVAATSTGTALSPVVSEEDSIGFGTSRRGKRTTRLAAEYQHDLNSGDTSHARKKARRTNAFKEKKRQDSDDS